MTDLKQRIQGLSPDKRAILERMLLKSGPSAARPSIPKRTGPGPYPLPMPQQRLWFLSELHPDGRAYNEPFAARIRGPLDASALECAINEIVRRHDALRTTFSLVDGRPVQVVVPALAVPLPMTDLASLDASAREDEARKAALREVALPFDIARGPLMRARLIRLDEGDHILVTVTHHIVTDGTSAGIFLKELSALYGAFAAGEESPLPEVEAQYPDFAVWQAGELGPETVEKQLAYWRTRLEGLTPLEVPADRPRPPVQTFAGGHLRFPIDADALATVDELGRREGATRFMTLLAVYAALLHRYTGREDVVIGTPVSGRDRPELAGAFGLFTKPIVLRVDLSGDPSFSELVRRVRETALGAYAHQDMPFEKLLEALPQERNLCFPPLFQTMFAIQNLEWRTLALGALRVEPFDFEIGTAKFDLTVLVGDGDGRPEVLTEYNADLFGPATVARMAGHFGRLLVSIAADPGKPVSSLDMLTAAERRTILVDWNDTARDYPRDKCVHELFEEWAARTPEAVAVVAGNASITYRELDERANRLANYLKRLLKGPEPLVGLCVERSIDMAVAMLGALKAGGAYVPLDPGYPADRIKFMLDDTALSVLLTQSRLLRRLPPSSARVVCLDADWPSIAAESAAHPGTSATAESLVYVIYTSGSTGKPKGTAVRHRGVTRLVLDRSYIPIEPSDAVAQAASICFDGSVFEIWGPLLNGARMVVIPKETLLSPRDFEAEVRTRGVTIADLSTPVLNHIAAEAPSAFSGFKYLAHGGEAADPVSLRRVLGIADPPRHLINDYGPTECTDVATWYEVKAVPDGVRSVPIGRPIANTQCYILDRRMQPMPVGVPGELCLGGDGLARGYLNRDDLTRERFVSNPFSTDPSSRIYRTGDLARYLPDGNIEFLGRADTQVKIRGFRVELEEIETVLGAHEAVRETVVLCREDRPGDKRLVAYVSPAPGARPGAADLRAFLEARLPGYMVPSAYVVMPSLPLTTSGKIDRAALPAPDVASEAAVGLLAPRTPVEEALARVWAEVLDIPQVGVRDSFFDLGGHSLLAVGLFTKIEKVFGKKLPLVTLFEGPTVEKLAAVISEDGRSGVFPPLVTIERGNGKVPLFCVATADAFLYADLARRLGPDQPVYGLHPQGIIPRENPHIDIRVLADRYVEELCKVRPNGPYLVGGLCAGGVVAWEMAQILRTRGQEVSAVVLFDTPGWLGPIDRWSISLSRATRVADHAYHHFTTLMRLDPRKRVDYVLACLERVMGDVAPTSARSNRVEALARVEKAARAVAAREVSVERAYWMAYNGAYTQSMAHYVPRPYSGKVVIFMAEDPGGWQFAEGRLKWRDLARGGADVHVIPSTHERMLHEPAVGIVAEQLKAYIETARPAMGR